MSKLKGIVYEYEDGGTYCGEWENDSSHGYGCCTGPGGQGRYEGLWENGSQVSGVYVWPNGMIYAGTWKNNRRDGYGKETREDGTEYSGEFVRGARGPYGVTKLPNGVYRGSWRNGKQDGEGEEVYLDGGCYRGQYKNGIRSGFGARTSAAYEHRDKEALKTQDASLKHNKLSTLISPLANLKHMSTSSTSSSRNSSSDNLANLEMGTSQIYEGEWKEDKRNGYGVIKCIGSYTYYGQWVNNTRTGYGVMVYENGTKTEGQFQNGQLIVALKRKKLHLKSHQLETKVQTAHTQAIQAADSARNKALLAVSRATSSMGKAKSAQVVSVKAAKDAQIARERAELYKNAPKISEGIKSPLLDMAMSISTTPSSSLSSNSPRIHRLEVTNTVPRGPSYEDITSIAAPHSSDSDSHSEDETKSMDGTRLKSFTICSSSTDTGFCWKRKKHSYQPSASENPLQYSSLPNVHRKFSEGANSERNKHSPKNNDRREILSKMSEEEEELERTEEEDQMGSLWKRRRKRMKRNKTTGELEQSATDEETTDDHLPGHRRKTTQIKPYLLQSKHSATMMLVNNLNQMANWNKMVAYVNFILLLVLFFLIFIVVVSMGYYQLTFYYHNHAPEDQSPTTNFISPIA